ncbi:MAG: esterase family protein [Rubrivivax sp.]|nr:esterase family protein [Rubrivivax sp.]
MDALKRFGWPGSAGAAQRLACTLAWLLAVWAGAACAGEVRTSSFRSDALQDTVHYTLLLPEGYDSQGPRYPVLYLLHGHGGSEHDWLRHGRLQATVDELITSRAVPPFIVVMPGGGKHWWVDSAAARAQTALVHDLVQEVDARWHTLPRREGRMIAGLSAGGFGALMAALRHPDRYSAAAVLSPAIYVPEPPADSAARTVPAFQRHGQFDAGAWQALNYPAWWDAYRRQPHQVALYIHSGDHDHLGIAWQSALLFQRVVAHQPQAVALRISDGGHEWAVWQRALPEAIRFLFEHRLPKRQPRHARRNADANCGRSIQLGAPGRILAKGHCRS